MSKCHFAGRCVVTDHDCRRSSRVVAALVATCAFACDDDGPAIKARFQEIIIDEPLAPDVKQRSVNVVAHASSGLPVTYGSLTPSTCSVNESTGVVTGIASGTCTIEVNQSGDAEFAPARPATRSISFQLGHVVTFESTLSLGLYDTVTVTAVDSSGLSLLYRTTTPLVCSVDSEAGLVTAIAIGTCTITATAGDTQIAQSATVRAPAVVSAPLVPQGVTATSAGAPNRVSIRAKSITSGGSPITGYAARSVPAGTLVTTESLPVFVTCPSSCVGYAFTLAATNAIGSSSPSVAGDIITTYEVTTIFHEPDTQPNDSMFIGQYVFDATTTTVSSLRGRLSEVMTGGSSSYPNDTMNWLSLTHQLSAQPLESHSASGLLVTTFLLPTTNTLASDAAYGGSDGWAPGSGKGLYYGYPGLNPSNAYVTVFVNTEDPLAPSTQEQIDKLAYADCAPGGMMGATCMTATSVAGYGSVGTMSGYPMSQTTVQR